MKNMIWQAPDGTIAISTFAEPLKVGETEAQYLDRQAAKLKADGAIPANWTRVADVEPNTLPGDREFRNAWRWTGAAVSEDLGKAKEIHQARLKTRFEKRFQELRAELDSVEGNIGEENRVKGLLSALRALKNTTDSQIAGATSVASLKEIRPPV